MKSLMEDLKNNDFKKVYLLCGEETYLKNLYKNKLKSALIPDEDSMNLNVYEGKGINVKEMIDQSETMPFFADRRLIVVENSGFFKNASADLADYIPQIPESTCMIFVEGEIDRRSKTFKAVKNAGRVVEMGRQDEKSLIRWILGILKKEEKNISEATMHLFLEKTGDDMEHIQRELEKLVCYTLDKNVITAEDVEEICGTRTVNKIFDMINAISEKRQKKALELYYDLLSLKEPPMRILFLITRQFNLLMQVKELRGQGFDGAQLASKIGLQSFVVKNYVRQCQAFTKEQLREAVTNCVEAEEAVKTGQLNDVMSVELLIVKFASGSL